MNRITTWTIGLCLALLLACGSVYAQDPALPGTPPNDEVPLVPKVPPVTPEVQPETKSPLMKWPAVFDCGPTGYILGVVKGKYKEIEFILSNGFVQLPDGRVLQAPTLIYLNPQTKTYSVVAHFQNGHSCIITSGKDLQPAPQNGNVNPKEQAPKGPGLKPGKDNKGPYLEARPEIEVNFERVEDDRILALLN